MAAQQTAKRGQEEGKKEPIHSPRAATNRHEADTYLHLLRYFCAQVLDEAARQIEQDRPWYEALGLRWEKVGESDGIGSDVAVEAVLAFNVVNGLIDAANQTVLAPVFVIVKGLLAAVQVKNKIDDIRVSRAKLCGVHQSTSSILVCISYLVYCLFL